MATPRLEPLSTEPCSTPANDSGIWALNRRVPTSRTAPSPGPANRSGSPGRRLVEIRTKVSSKPVLAVGGIECEWCNREATWTVDYEECGHHAVCCDECWLEYFSGEHWLGDIADCPTCSG